MSRSTARSLLLAASLLLAGCGGGGGSSLPKPRLSIDWPARGRSLSAPGTAESARLVLYDPNSEAVPLSMVVKRPSAETETIRSYSFPKGIRPGSYALLIEFFADSVPPGQQVGTANVPVQVGDNGQLLNADGTPFGGITLMGTVVQVSIAAKQSITLGEKRKLEVGVYTTTGKAIVPPAGSMALQITGDGLVADKDGTLTARTEGTYTVVATVDGVSSAPTTVTVTAMPVAVRTLALDVTDLVVDSTRGRLYATQREGYTGRIVEIDPANGTVLRQHELAAEPLALAISDDHSLLYAGARSTGTIERIALPDFTPQAPISLREGEFTDGRSASGIAVAPGHPNTIAATIFAGTFDHGILILDSGVARPRGDLSSMSGYAQWSSPDRLLVGRSGYWPAYFALAVGPDGGVIERSVQQGAYSTGMGFTLANGRVYTNDLSVLDAATLEKVGRLGPEATYAPGPTIYGPTVDTEKSLVFFVEVDLDGARLQVYRTTDLTRVTTRPIVGFSNNGPFVDWRHRRLVRWGAKGLAFSTSAGILLIDAAPGL